MGWSVRRVLAGIIFLASGLNYYFWEFVRAKIYDRVWAMVEPFVPPPDFLARAGVTLALFAAGAALLWKTRPTDSTVNSSISPVDLTTGQWFNSFEIGNLGNPDLVQAANIDSQRVGELEQEGSNIQAEIFFGHQKPLDAFTDKTDPDYEKLEELRARHTANFTALHEAKQKKNISFTRALNDLYEKLREQKLIAKGFLMPIELGDDKVTIPPSYWHFLRFNGDFTEAKGEDFEYKHISVARLK